MSRAGDLRNITATGTSSENDYVLTYDDATKKVSLEVAQGGDVVNDTTPQLGGDLDNNGKNINISASSTGSGNNRLTVGPNAEFSLYHNASLGTYMVEKGSGSMRFMASDFKLQNFAGTHEYIVMTDSGSVAISHGNGKKFETTTTGVAVTGTLTASGLYSTDFAEIRADDSEIYLTNAANNKYFRIKRDGSDIDFDIYNGSSVSTKLMLTEDGILQGISNSEIKTSPIRIHTNTINQNTTIASSENAVSGGPITIASGVTVTVSGDWTVV